MRCFRPHHSALEWPRPECCSIWPKSPRNTHGNNTHFPADALHKLNYLLCLFITVCFSLAWRARVMVQTVLSVYLSACLFVDKWRKQWLIATWMFYNIRWQLCVTTHANGCRRGRVVPRFVCVSVLPHDISNTDAAVRITKLEFKNFPR